MKINLPTSHELSPATMAFMATEIDGSWGTKIYLEGGDKPIFVNYSPSKLIAEAYRQQGEELLARFDGAKILCGFKNKSPIAISVTNGYYFFPTHSPTHQNCSWFSHNHVVNIKKSKYGGSIVYFEDGQKLTTSVSEGTMHNQRNRTAQYRFALEREIKPLQYKAVIRALMKILRNDL